MNKFSVLLFLLLGCTNCTNKTPKQQENVIITPAPHLKKEVVVQLDKINNEEYWGPENHIFTKELQGKE